MDDIEDFGEGGIPEQRTNERSLIFPKKRSTVATGNNHNEDVDMHTDTVPGTQKVWIRTFGCSHNVSDSEYMEGILQSYGFRITSDQNEADVWVINSCTVKDPSQSAFMHIVQQAKKNKIPLVVAGCVPQGDRKLPGLENVSVVGVQQIDRVVEAVEETIKGNTVRMLGKKNLPRLDLPKVRKNPLVEIIPLSTGCLGACTYCKTKHARGKLGSYELSSIIERAKSVIAEGVAEIWLSSEDTGAYGIDLGITIVDLLQGLVAILPKDGSVVLRVGMTNPPYILEHLEAIADILNHPFVYSFLHVPVQAASNSVLLEMNREYTIEEFNRVVDLLYERVPDMTIATDIICGFPNETEADFDMTMALIEKYKFAIVNISQFYPRPGTPAAKMKRLPTDAVKARSRRLTKLFESFDPYSHYVTTPYKVIRVWFDTEISNDGGHSVGHSKNYIKVLVPLDDNLPGTSYMVEIHKAHRFHLEGVVVGERLATSRDNIVPHSSANALKTSVKTMENCTDGDCGGNGGCDDGECCGGGGCDTNKPKSITVVATNAVTTTSSWSMTLGSYWKTISITSGLLVASLILYRWKFGKK